MSDENTIQPQAAAQQGNRPSLNLQIEGADLDYANMAVVTSTPEEVIVNFGLNAVPPDAEGQVNVQVTNRVILSYPSVKRLAVTLGNIVKRYEEQHGVIEIRRQQPRQTQAAGSPPQEEE